MRAWDPPKKHPEVSKIAPWRHLGHHKTQKDDIYASRALLDYVLDAIWLHFDVFWDHFGGLILTWRACCIQKAFNNSLQFKSISNSKLTPKRRDRAGICHSRRARPISCAWLSELLYTELEKIRDRPGICHSRRIRVQIHISYVSELYTELYIQSLGAEQH